MPRRAGAGLLVVAIIAALAVMVATRQAGPAASAAATGPVLPDRRAPAAAAPALPPPVPPAADRIAPMAYTVTTTWTATDGVSRSTVQHVTRTASRVHLVLDNGRKEWVFDRNLVHPDRVSGVMVDHDARQILQYDETELRTALQLRGWADVLMMRVDPSVLAGLRATGDERQVAGLTFRLHRAEPPPDRGMVEVWWNQEQLLALGSVARESATLTVTTRVEDLRTPADAAVLGNVADRFPDYERLDAIDASDHRDAGH
jgi:hypothetical protein